MSYKSLIALVAMLFLVMGKGSLSAQSPVGSALSKCAARQVSPAPTAGVLASDGHRVYAGTIDGTLTAFDADTLEIAWRAELGGEFASNIIVSDVGLFVVTNGTKVPGSIDNSTLRLIGKESGITGWTVSLANSEHFYLGRINGGVAAVNKEGAITLAERVSGQVRWQAGPFGKISARPSFSGESIVFATSEKQLMVVSGKDGGLITRQSSDFVPTSVAFLKNEGFVAGDERGNVALFGPKGAKSVWRFKSGAGVSAVASDPSGILVASLDNFVYFISDYNGDVIWKRRLTGRVVDAGLAIDQQLIVLINGENSIFLIDVQNGKVTDVISAMSSDLISRVPVFVREKTFAISTINSVETYSVGGCLAK